MSSSAFPRFSELPTELQIEIWSYAATPTNPIRLTEDFLTNIKTESLRQYDESYYYPFFRLTSKTWLPFMSWGAYGQRAGCLETAKTRANLMGTCRLAWQVVVETWRREVEAIELRREQPGTAHKKEVVEFLSAMIEECQR